MPELRVLINGKMFLVPQGTTVAAAMLQAGVPCRISQSGEARAALCGMGICLECRAIVDGVRQSSTCQAFCKEGMTMETQP